MSVSLFSVGLDLPTPASWLTSGRESSSRPVDEGGSVDFATIGLAGDGSSGPAWMSTGSLRPSRPKIGSYQFIAAEWQAEVKRVLGLGASHLGDVDESGFQWATLTDPEGNEFDIVAAPQ